MLLTGTYSRSVDEKLRVAVPRAFRDGLLTGGGGLVFIAPGMDGSLAVYSEEAFGRLGTRVAAASPTERDVRAFARLFFARAQAVELDRQGRLRLPLELARFAGIEREVMFVGVRDHLELWPPARWKSYLSDTQARYDEIAEAALNWSKHQA